MCINNKKYNVIVGEYAKNHYIKPFKKKYKSVWWKTFETIEFMLKNIEKLLKTLKVNKIHICDIWYIAKYEFNIEWIKVSTKASWNRIIIFVNEEKLEITILLVYAKTNIKWANETAWWENEIKKNYKQIALYFSNL